MYQIRQTAVRFADTALLLTGINAGLDFLIRLYPTVVSHNQIVAENKAVLLNPLTYLSSVISLVLFIVLYVKLKRDIADGAKNAGTLLVLVLVFMGGMPVVSLLLNWLRTLFIRYRYSSEQLAAVSMLSSAFSLTALISALSRPLLTAAAALNYACSKQNPQEIRR